MSRSGHTLTGLFILLIGGGGAALLALAFHFSFLLPQGHGLFRLQHHYLEHLAFHTDRYDYQAGDSIQVFVSLGKGDSVQVSLYPVSEADSLVRTKTYSASFQPLPARPSVSGTEWKPSFSISIPANAIPGWYVLAVSDAKRQARSSVFIQPAPERVQRKVALVFSTNTWNAYNPWGGQSLYTRNHTPIVSFLRPQPLSDPFLANSYANHQLYYQAANRELPLWELLQEANIPADAFSMEALHQGDPRLLDYSALIFSTHAEYWSWDMMHHLNACLDSGASALVLAGNVAAYLTEIDPDKRSMKVQRRRQDFWEFADTTQLRPFGTQYTHKGFHSYSPFEISNDTSWVWEGLGIQKGDLLGQVSDTYDYTYMYESWFQNLLGLRNRGKKGAASGLEIDKVYAHTPTNWVQLAAGLNPAEPAHGEIYPDSGVNWETKGGADMGYYQHPGGGIVFHASSMSFSGALEHDTQLRTMLLHIIERSLQARPQPPTP